MFRCERLFQNRGGRGEIDFDREYSIYSRRINIQGGAVSRVKRVEFENIGLLFLEDYGWS